MRTTRFGKPDLRLHPIGFGAWQLANAEAWGAMSEGDAVALVQAALAKGIDFFDTAPGYGNGKSESILGEALEGNRDSVILSTKFGHRADGTTDWRVEAIEPSLRESLKRLRTDYADCLLLHNPSLEILHGNTGHWEELRRLRKLGLIRGFGASIDTPEELKCLLSIPGVEVAEILFNVFFQSPRDLFDQAKEKGLLLIAKVPLDSGWLSGKYDASSTFEGIRSRWSQAIIRRRAELVRDVQTIVGTQDTSLAALAFILSFPAIGCVIPGMKNIRQLQDNLAANAFHLLDEQRQKLIDLYDHKIRHHPLPW